MKLCRHISWAKQLAEFGDIKFKNGSDITSRFVCKTIAFCVVTILGSPSLPLSLRAILFSAALAVILATAVVLFALAHLIVCALRFVPHRQFGQPI